MKRSKLWLIIVAGLLLVNTAVLATLWLKRPNEAPSNGGGAKDFLIRELSLTTSQQERFDDLRKEHQKDTRQVMEGMKDLKDALADEIASPEADSASIELLTSGIHEKEKQRDLLTIYHFRAFRTILTAEQKEKFDKLLRKVLRMMSVQRPPQAPPTGEDGKGPHPQN